MTIAQAATSDPPATRERLTSIDILRGAVMVLMAIDHVRVYSGVPAGGPTAGIFFTRWVTHFCAPAFVFFAGTSAFLYRRAIAGSTDSSSRANARLAQYLVTRGLMLVVLELTLIRFTWTFNVDYSSFVLAGVIWMLGWCMVLMAGLVWLPTAVIGALGVALIILQQVFGLVPRVLPASAANAIGPIWEFIYPSGFDAPPPMTILYVLVPWIGVMAAGYAFGAILVRDADRRRRLCLWIGMSATALFVIGAGLGVALNAAPEGPPVLFRLLGQQKYPASVLFLLMTLGPTIAAMPFAERWRGSIADVLATFGRVPMFYYLLHIPTIHVAALIVNMIRTGSAHGEWYSTAPYAQVPPDQRWGLPLLYLVFFLVVAILYVPCRWYADLKRRKRSPWLAYL
jgi:uncharacterized membrane protein